MGRRDVDLLDLIVNDDDEACDRSVDDGDRRLADPFRRSGSERFLRSGVDQLLRNEPEVSISPAEIPDLSDGAGVLLVPLAKHHVSVVGHRQPNLATRGAATRRQFLSLGLPPAHAGARDTLWRPMSEAEQLGALARLHELFERNRIEYWLFGGWAVDFHAGSVTRPHDDLDLAVWLQDHDRIAALLAADGGDDAPEEDEDEFTGYVRRAVHLELAFLARDENGHVYTPLREGRAAWPGEAFESDLRELRGVRARIISLQVLRADKSEAHDDPRGGPRRPRRLLSPLTPTKRGEVESGCAARRPRPPLYREGRSSPSGHPQRFPKPRALVRFRPGASACSYKNWRRPRSLRQTRLASSVFSFPITFQSLRNSRRSVPRRAASRARMRRTPRAGFGKARPTATLRR